MKKHGKPIYTQRFKDAIRTLVFWQPGALAIRRNPSACPVCHSAMYLTYTLPSPNDNPPLDETLEYCGMYCAACKFGQVGARKRICR